MRPYESLENYLEHQVSTDRIRRELAETIASIARASVRIARRVARGSLAGAPDRICGTNIDGDAQKELDVLANDYIVEAMRDAPVACVVSEELDEPLPMQRGAPLFVAVDPLDGSSNIETNNAVGTIFSIVPAGDDVVLQRGIEQLAAGYCIYGPQTSFVLTHGAGTHIFTLDAEDNAYRLTSERVQIAQTTREFAINVSNFRHWDRHVRAYIDDCLEGSDGFRQSNYNMRWLASLVAECHRILARGGIFLYPADARKGYARGRLRLVYECNPIAFVVEQAGGGATTGLQRIMEIHPQHIHQRVPMIFGSSREIRRITRYYAERDLHGERSQLFKKRGLFRS